MSEMIPERVVLKEVLPIFTSSLPELSAAQVCGAQACSATTHLKYVSFSS